MSLFDGAGCGAPILLESTVSEARPAMNELALEVGLPEDRWTPEELAKSAVARGRTGKAVIVALDYAREAVTARRTIVDDLVRPVGQETVSW